MKRLLVFILPIAFCVQSCSYFDDDIGLAKEPPPIKITTATFRDVDMAVVNDGFKDFWQETIDDYGFERICSCDSTGVNFLPELFNNHSELIFSDLGLVNPDSFKILITIDTTIGYDSMLLALKPDCTYLTDSTLIAQGQYVVSTTNMMTNEEKTLIDSLIEDAADGVIDSSYYRDQWNELAFSSQYNNQMSGVIIETAIAAQDFINNSGNNFPELEGGINEMLLPHLVGAVAGGLWGAGWGIFAAATQDMFCEECPPNEDFGDEAVAGFIGGAISGAIMTI